MRVVRKYGVYLKLKHEHYNEFRHPTLDQEIKLKLIEPNKISNSIRTSRKKICDTESKYWDDLNKSSTTVKQVKQL